MDREIGIAVGKTAILTGRTINKIAAGAIGTAESPATNTDGFRVSVRVFTAKLTVITETTVISAIVKDANSPKNITNTAATFVVTGAIGNHS